MGGGGGGADERIDTGKGPDTDTCKHTVADRQTYRQTDTETYSVSHRHTDTTAGRSSITEGRITNECDKWIRHQSTHMANTGLDNSFTCVVPQHRRDREKECAPARKRERERERERERQTDRQTDRQRHRDRQTDRLCVREKGGAEWWGGGGGGSGTDRQMNTETDPDTERDK